ncbi:MAG: HAD family hydrolase, partial [Clostridia bacterium]
MESIIDQYDLFILDMDGTIYLDIYPINGAIEFINKLKEKNKKYVFLTNNSSKSYVQYIDKLNNLGFI